MKTEDEMQGIELKELEDHLAAQLVFSKPKMGKFSDAHFFHDFD